MTIRTFHPVGQGAFYSERNNDFNIVYDCGTNSYATTKSVVELAFQNEKIDTLFISHFDFDHISMIPVLVDSVESIRLVVIPLLDNQQRNLLINFMHNLSDELKQLITNPKAFFGSNTTVIEVRPASGFNEDNNQEPRDIDELIDSAESNSGTIKIDSGTPLIIGNRSNLKSRNSVEWVLVPYNYEDKIRQAVLLDKLEKEGFDLDRLKNDPSYVLDSLNDHSTWTVLKSIYNQLKGKINQNSMLLYSGPSFIKDKKEFCFCDCIPIDPFYHHMLCHTCIHKSGCIYTGDCDFNNFKLKDVYPSYVEYVGIIQVPHHGAVKNFDLKAFEGFEKVICPISHGTKNKHPDAEVVKELIINGFKVVSVNEKEDSKFQQRIFSCA